MVLPKHGVALKPVNIPKQATIFCGGLGTRLLPLTKNTPKPMVLINDRPFLHYLIEQLKSYGIDEFVLMTGYLGEQIKQYFGDGSHFGVNILYSQGPIKWHTARRLYEAKSLLADNFLLLYADNFVPTNLYQLFHFHQQQSTSISLLLKEKAGGNIATDKSNIITHYDKTRKADNLNFVELGYMIVSKVHIFSYYNSNIDISFSDILHRVVANKQLSGMTILDNYYSISDDNRLTTTKKYLQPKKILLIDRDGIINRKAPRGEYISSWGDFIFIEQNVTALKKLSTQGFKFIIVSNQAGIARKMLSAKMLENIHQKMLAIMTKKGISILNIYVCPHHFDEHCDCRKPKPGMLLQASKDFLLRLDNTFFIGDDPRDCQAAYWANCKSIFIGKQNDLIYLSKPELPNLIVKDLTESTHFITDHDYFKNAI